MLFMVRCTQRPTPSSASHWPPFWLGRALLDLCVTPLSGPPEDHPGEVQVLEVATVPCGSSTLPCQAAGRWTQSQSSVLRMADLGFVNMNLEKSSIIAAMPPSTNRGLC